MDLTKDDLEKIDEIAATHTEELAVLVSRGFERVEAVQAEQTKLLQEHSELHEQHSDDLGQIKGQTSGIQKLADYHDREVERLLKHAKLKPLMLEE